MIDPLVLEFKRREELLKKIRGSKEAQQAVAVHYRLNPVDFINDWAVTHDPRIKPSLRPFTLWPRQVEYINWLHNKDLNREDGLVEKSRDMGITWLCCAYAWWKWIWETDQVVSFGSRKEDLVDKRGDPDCIFEKIRMLIGHTPPEFLPEDFAVQKHDSHMRLINPTNGTVIKGEAGDNIGRGGRSSLYFKDESAFYERPDSIEAALSQNSDVKIDVSTPNGIGNPFYRKRHGGIIDVFTFHWSDDPRKDDAWYEKQKALLDPVILAQEVDLSYDASVDNAFIASSFVKKAMEAQSHQFDLVNVPLCLGVDPARFGNDKSGFVMRQGRVVHWSRTREKLNTMQIVGIVVNLIQDSTTPLNVFVDVVGLGAGVYDRLYEIFPDNVWPVTVSEESGLDNCINKRAEIWYKMREWLKGNVSIPNDDTLMVDLCGLQYSYNSNGKLVLESKKDAKKRGLKSPDVGDALALTFSLPEVMLQRDEDEFYEQESRRHAPKHVSGRNTTTGY